MTVVVAFHCSDGAVVASDSMLTPSMGGISVGHHSGIKCCVITGPQLFAFSGNQGQASRLRYVAESLAPNIGATAHPLLHGVAVSTAILNNLLSTGIPPQQADLNAFLAFMHGGNCHICAFEGSVQPRLLDNDHCYAALGSGKLSADPFLRFLFDTFCLPGVAPRVHLATFLATWTVQHVINVNPGGVAGPIRISVFERDALGVFAGRDLSTAEIDAHLLAVENATGALRAWRNGIQGGGAAGGVAAPPNPPINA